MKNDDNNLTELWMRDEKEPFRGWDFSYIRNRIKEETPPWDYKRLARKLVRKSESVLDMGTGGGEIFSSLGPFPKHAIATEGYKPNYILARKRLGNSGVNVVEYRSSTKRKMPFGDGEFDLVLNRHDAFNPRDVYRILAPGGIFLTQQVGNGNLRNLTKNFHCSQKYNGSSLKSIKKELAISGFSVKYAKEWKGKREFKDVGAVVYFLKAIPWIVPGFSVRTHVRYLQKLQNKIGRGEKLVFTEMRYLILSKKT